MSDAATNFDMAGKLWDLANLITGFAAVQSMATLFAMAKDEWAQTLTSSKTHKQVIWGTVWFNLLYIVAIICCGLEGYLINGQNGVAWLGTTIGRVVTILLFGGTTIVTFLGHKQQEEREEKEKLKNIDPRQSPK